VFFDDLERRQRKLSFGSGLSSKRFVDHSVWPWQGAAPPILGQLSLVSCRVLSPGWGCPNWSPSTLGRSLFGVNSVAATTLGFGFCLILVFHRETDLFHCNCDVESFCCESSPHSYSSPPWRFILLWSELEPHIYLCFIHIRNFRLRAYTFLLVFLNSLVGKSLIGKVIRVVLGW
jgi:hypothetical protein